MLAACTGGKLRLVWRLLARVANMEYTNVVSARVGKALMGIPMGTLDRAVGCGELG